MKWISRWLFATILSIALMLSISCGGSNSNYTKVVNPNWFSVDCPKGFEYSIDPDSMGSSPEVDMVQTISVPSTDDNGNPITSSVEGIGISVYGVNGAYSDVVDYDSNVAPMTRDRLATRGNTVSVFKWGYQSPDPEQFVEIVRDMGSLRTIVVLGTIRGPVTPDMDILTRYCTEAANSVTASPRWVSNGTGP